MIEIIARDTCSKCEGTRRRRVIYHQHEYQVGCDFCNGVGTVSRVLATFADAAALRPILQDAIDRAHDANKEEWEDYLTEEQAEAMVSAVLAALGVSDDQG